jgi:hypothetical protein
MSELTKIEWIEREWAIAPADQKVNANIFTAYLNTVITVEKTVIAPPILSLGDVSESIPVPDRFILQNTAIGTYTSLLKNLADSSIPDVIRDLENLASAPISATAKTVIENIISGLREYITSPARRSPKVIALLRFGKLKERSPISHE